MYNLPAASYFIDCKPATGLGDMTHGEVSLKRERSWIAFVLVFCGHLATFAALRPEPLTLETPPEPIMVSLVSAPQSTPKAPVPMPPEKAMTKMQKHVKQPQSIRNTPIKKSVVQRTKPSTLSDIAPVEQSSVPIVTPVSHNRQQKQTPRPPTRRHINPLALMPLIYIIRHRIIHQSPGGWVSKEKYCYAYRSL